MPLNKKVFETKYKGEVVSLEVSDLAGQANAAVIGRWGNTSVLATVVMGKQDTQGDFFPLTVDYEERFYAAGKIIGSRFIRREGRPSDEAILSGRLIDRTIRPLFDPNFRREVQVTVTVLAYEENHDPDFIGLLSCSTAILISDIPWNGPVAGVQYESEEKNANGDFVFKAFFAGIADRVNMIEFEGNEISEEKAIELFDKSQKEISELVSFQKRIAEEIGKKKFEITAKTGDESARNAVRNILLSGNKLQTALKEKKMEELSASVIKTLAENEKYKDSEKDISSIFEEEISSFVREKILSGGERPDGRALNEIRPVFAEVGLFELTHGSGFFTRGNTQVLALSTLASPSAEQLVETMEITGKKRFLLHYNFPSFSVGETGRSRGPGRREIGHGALTAKALKAVIPPKQDFPYTIRVVAETLSSNGSSSMASACATSLSLMDAGVPIRGHVAGIAIGLVLNEKSGAYKILTDIQGPEDYYGDMDFKVAGTKNGITAIQMDVKIRGITPEIFREAIAGAKEARLSILKSMEAAIEKPRSKVSAHAPKILSVTIPKEKIGEVIGSGGKTINGIIAESGDMVAIDIEENGTVYVSGIDEELVKKALDAVKATVKEFKVGEVVSGKVVKILDFGAIVNLGGNKDGMVHVSELKDGFVKKVEDVVRVGDSVTAKVIRVDADGRIGLSLKNVPQIK